MAVQVLQQYIAPGTPWLTILDPFIGPGTTFHACSLSLALPELVREHLMDPA